ncbi:MAG TPA: SWIM zinc finger family protein [Verrucomicrobiae bacterium]|nr:SWIM zinc finger family protein [Verrucomicrobiae bacterium]
MDATTKTIDFLRTLTVDGYLTSDEVWSLGRFLLDNPECTASWPGNLLSPMLESAFDDARLSTEEMQLIAEMIGSIEEEWRMKNPRAAEAEEDDLPVSFQPALIPVIDAKFEMPSREDESFVVMLDVHSCTCPDWQARPPLPPRHPGKCCKHVAHAFTRTGKVFEPWFQAVLDDCFARGKGLNPNLNWLLLQLPSTKPAVLAGGAGAWCNVFAPGEKGYEQFAFNTAQQRWSYDAAPQRSRVIERVIRQNFVTPPATSA